MVRPAFSKVGIALVFGKVLDRNLRRKKPCLSCTRKMCFIRRLVTLVTRGARSSDK